MLYGINLSFERLSPSYRQVAYALLTRAPVVTSEASSLVLPLDLHVLGLSLAFILSQDQTLRCKILLDQTAEAVLSVLYCLKNHLKLKIYYCSFLNKFSSLGIIKQACFCSRLSRILTVCFSYFTQVSFFKLVLLCLLS